ncbi:hypothetical protein GGS23DRAFT_592130 [Durotheca rogersii]|uniref:uncharacterized protein n=1 Tax=Durotheca rogersii TaxID=419775 RepID=UPI00221EFB33|nr:uncharacterized protein GGS23DRAFT_592130 [Durotheca rogersii]KAI5868351.1 hypothetical protein GGS23DRAFT_592130 [Durotheca rogersii]
MAAIVPGEFDLEMLAAASLGVTRVPGGGGGGELVGSEEEEEYDEDEDEEYDEDEDEEYDEDGDVEYDEDEEGGKDEGDEEEGDEEEGDEEEGDEEEKEEDEDDTVPLPERKVYTGPGPFPKGAIVGDLAKSLSMYGGEFVPYIPLWRFRPYYGEYQEALPDHFTAEDYMPDDPDFIAGPEEDQDCLGIGSLVKDGLKARDHPFAGRMSGYDEEYEDSDDDDADKRRESAGKPTRESILARFSVDATFTPDRDQAYYMSAAAQFLQELFKYCARHEITVKEFSDQDIDTLQGRIEWSILDWPSEVRNLITGWFYYQVRAERAQLRATAGKDLDPEQLFDPNHIRVVGLSDIYRAWSVTEDTSVDGEGMIMSRYEIPRHVQFRFPSGSPLSEYRWFGAEVISPVLPVGTEVTAETIRRACASLRNRFRIHKPMERSTGFHVHLGHKHGWNLLHLKRFITLWLLIETTLVRIHRKDRGSDYMKIWCGPLTETTRLARYHGATNNIEREIFEDYVPRTAPYARNRNQQRMRAHVPMHLLEEKLADFVNHVWLYTSIDSIVDAFSGAASMRPGVRIRISGNKVSQRPGSGLPQTIEVRTMQGTLDADHINHWIVVLTRILYYTRRATDEEYRMMLEEVLNTATPTRDVGRLLEALGVPDRTTQYFLDGARRKLDAKSGVKWWAYPDDDLVDWADPFMARGHGATHGPEWDEVVTAGDRSPEGGRKRKRKRPTDDNEDEGGLRAGLRGLDIRR